MVTMSNPETTVRGWCCTDCLMWLANGETPPELNAEDCAAWLAEIDRRADGGHWEIGGEHTDDCPNIDHETGEWIGNTDCYCEQVDFTWSACDVCGTTLGGARDAVTWERDR